MKKLANEFMEKILNDSAWKELSGEFQWTEQMLEKYKDMVDWKEISSNDHIVWTPTMLEKFRKLIDWQKLSTIDCETILTEAILAQFVDYWDWTGISQNKSLKLSFKLIDKFVDRWDWAVLIDRWRDDDIYNAAFWERYGDKIPTSKLQDSYLWESLVKERAMELKLEVIA